MSFLNPIYLWSLLGVLVPIAIHLWNRKKVLTIKVGSIKMLKASESKRTSSFRPNEWWLLLLRILMITLFAFILAGPNFKSIEKKQTLRYVVDPELIHLKSMEPLLDSLPSQGLHIMVSGFPLLKDYDFETSKSFTPKYWQMAQAMEKLQTDSIVVFTKGLVSGIQGMRPTVSKSINWILIDAEDKITIPIEASLNKDSVELLFMESDRKSLVYTKSSIEKNSETTLFNATKDSIQINGDWIEVKPSKPLKVLIVADDSLSHELKYLKTAYRAVSKYLDKPIEIKTLAEIDTLKLESYATLVWLSDKNLDKYPIKSLLHRPDSLANQLIVDGNTKNTFFLTHPLNSENIITAHLSEKLLELLSLHEDVLKKAKKYDRRSIDAKELQTIEISQKNTRNYANLYDLSLWIWLILSMLLIVERILSKYRRQ